MKTSPHRPQRLLLLLVLRGKLCPQSPWSLSCPMLFLGYLVTICLVQVVCWQHLQSFPWGTRGVNTFVPTIQNLMYTAFPCGGRLRLPNQPVTDANVPNPQIHNQSPGAMHPLTSPFPVTLSPVFWPLWARSSLPSLNCSELKQERRALFPGAKDHNK